MNEKTAKPTKKTFELTPLSDNDYWRPEYLEFLFRNTHRHSGKVHNIGTITADDLYHGNGRATNAHSSAGVRR